MAHSRFYLIFLLCHGLLAVAQEPAAEDPKPDPLATAVKEARELLHKGEYTDCIGAAELAEIRNGRDRRLTSLKAKGRMAMGQYEEAVEVIESDWRIESTQEGQMLLYDIRRAQGDFETAEMHASTVFDSQRFSSASDLLAIGRAALIHGGEPKQILDRFYKQVLKMDPANADAYQYIGDLALEKYDYELAAENYDKGLQIEPDNTDLRCGLAKAFFQSERAHAVEILEKTLEINPKHVDSLLMMAEHHLLAELEDKSQAVEFIQRVEKVNGDDPRSEAMRAVMALIEADEAKAAKHRAAAKKGRARDPRIDYDIGRWMSSLMRFQEAIPFFRASLKTDAGFLPAKIALGLNLLRTGEEDEAWVILEGVSDRDQYNVAVYNLLALHDEIEDYKILNRENFIVRMESSEAQLYGGRVLDLLEQAQGALHAKYAFRPSKPILIEFFPEQEDFAVRTLGFVGGDGFLGACFGLVVTINSPNNGATGKTNWESTLWHEYCHAVTLGATRNRMPRWLTEGISVYEERRRDPSCGEKMSIDFRHMILDGDELIPLSRLNYGFLKPKTGKHMMFAYYQSSLFVEYFMEKFGEDKMRAIIGGLNEGVKFSQACKKHAKSLEQMEEEFFAYAKDTARAYGGALDWTVPEENLGAYSLEELTAWMKDHPANYYGLRAQASALLRAERYEEAEALLQDMVEKFPDHAEAGSPYRTLAELYRRMGNRERERGMLWSLISLSTDWLHEMLRLLDYEAEAGAWERVEHLAHQIMAVNPYISKAQRVLAESLAAREKNDEAVARYEILLGLKPANPAQIHFAVADLLQETEPARAKRHTLDALAEAPRYREALRLLRKLRADPGQEDSSSSE